jgi:hypothetical protein
VSGDDPLGSPPLVAPGGGSGVRSPASGATRLDRVGAGGGHRAGRARVDRSVRGQPRPGAGVHRADEAPVAPADPDEDGADADADAGEDPEPTETEEPPAAEIDGVELFLALEDASWMRVTVDGTVVFEQVANEGETLPFSGEENVTVRFGNAGGVRVEFNGTDLGSPGARGDVVEVEYTPDGPSDT